MAKTPKTELLSYKYRYYNSESEALFGAWLVAKDWNELFAADSSNKKAEIYQEEVTAAQNRYFPEVTVTRKASDPPWFNKRIRKGLSGQSGA